MLPYCLECTQKKENVDSNLLKTKNGRTMLLSKCPVYKKWNKQWKMKIYERTRRKRITSSLVLKTPVSKISLLGNIFVLNSLNVII